jgi:hypothetical protein
MNSNICPGRKITLDNCKAYATQANLEKGLAKLGLDRYDYVECRTAEGKWTAIFSFSDANIRQQESYVCFAAVHGFMTFG